MPFANRLDAGRQLAAAVIRHHYESPVVLALPRGGVPVGAAVAAAIGAPLDLLLVRKLGVPFQPELAMGAIVDGASPTIVRNDEVIDAIGISDEDFQAVCRRELLEVERRRRAYVGHRAPVEIAGKTAVVVDDGVATGATMRAALRSATARHPLRLIMAVPVAPADTLRQLRREVDDIVCLEAHDLFDAIGTYYADFTQVRDEEVVRLLNESPRPLDRPARSSADGRGGT